MYLSFLQLRPKKNHKWKSNALQLLKSSNIDEKMSPTMDIAEAESKYFLQTKNAANICKTFLSLRFFTAF